MYPAHLVGSEVGRAYRRSELLTKGRELSHGQGRLLRKRGAGEALGLAAARHASAIPQSHFRIAVLESAIGESGSGFDGVDR